MHSVGVLVYWWDAISNIYTKENHAFLFMLIDVTFNVVLFDEIRPVVFTAVDLSCEIHLTLSLMLIFFLNNGFSM